MAICFRLKRHALRKMTNRKKSVIFNLFILIAASSASECDNARSTGVLDEQLKKYVDGVLSVDNYDIVPGVYIERSRNLTVENGSLGDVGCGRGAFDIQNYVYRKLDQYSQTHVLAVNIPATARFFKGTHCHFHIPDTLKNKNYEFKQG